MIAAKNACPRVLAYYVLKTPNGQYQCKGHGGTAAWQPTRKNATHFTPEQVVETQKTLPKGWRFVPVTRQTCTACSDATPCVLAQEYSGRHDSGDGVPSPLPTLTVAEVGMCPIAQVGIGWPAGGSHVLPVDDVLKLIQTLRHHKQVGHPPRTVYGLTIQRSGLGVCISSAYTRGIHYTHAQVDEICAALTAASNLAVANVVTARREALAKQVMDLIAESSSLTC